MQTDITFGYPLKNTSPDHSFGEDDADHPLRKNFYKVFGYKHPGIDFSVPVGTPVMACFPGIVVRKEIHKGMGMVIGIRNGNTVTLYAHLSRYKVSLGQIIKKGQIIGLSGNSGDAVTKPHLHLEVRDITKPTLKEMVFEPPLGKKLRIKDSFNYIVNNANTTKTLKFLSARYFGSEVFWKKILNHNPKLKDDPKRKIEDKTKVLIPNF